jgi:hypothetical protein
MASSPVAGREVRYRAGRQDSLFLRRFQSGKHVENTLALKRPSLERDEIWLNRFWDSQIGLVLIQHAGWGAVGG